MANPGREGGIWRMHPLPAIFKHDFDEYKFSIISNFFDNNKLKPQAPIQSTLRKHNRKCSLQTKCVMFGETLRIRGKKFNQNMPENRSKGTKMVTTVCKFSKIYRGNMPSILSIGPFLLSICFKIILPKELRLKYMLNLGTLP